MRFMVAAVLVAFIATAAMADENPNIMIGCDSNNPPPPENNRLDPAPNGTIDVYVVAKNFGPGGGALGAAFLFERTFGGFKLAQTNLLPGLDFGDVEAGGWAITAGAECQFPDANGYLMLATVQYLYLGTPGTITIVEHPVDGLVISDCDNLLDTATVFSNFGVGTDAPSSPVEASTWSGIKGLYR
jgi:hypothetical protein